MIPLFKERNASFVANFQNLLRIRNRMTGFSSHAQQFNESQFGFREKWGTIVPLKLRIETIRVNLAKPTTKLLDVFIDKKNTFDMVDNNFLW